MLHGYEDGRFYVNWGWDGNEDGYFVLTGLNTGIGDFNTTQSATIGIHPPIDHEVNRSTVVVKNITYDGAKFIYCPAGNTTPHLEIEGTLASDLYIESASVGLALYDSQGFQKLLWEDQHSFTVNEEFHFKAAFTIDNKLTEGDYRIVPVCRNNDSSEWQSVANASDYYLKITFLYEYLKLVACPMTEEERITTDVSILTQNDITYYLYNYKGKNLAEVIPSQKGSYEGNINIPDDISYKSTDYHVYRADLRAFQNCDNLISLSSAMTFWPNVSYCSKLESIDMREGVAILNDPIEGCPLLNSVTFPQSLSKLRYGVQWCEHLKEIIFKNTDLVTFDFYPKWYSESLPALTDIYFYTKEPPAFLFEVGDFRINETATIHVQQDCKEIYLASAWKSWNIQGDLPAINPNGVEWGYCDGKKVSQMTIYDIVGDNSAEYAIRIPASILEAYKGQKISKIKYYQPNDAIEYVFITKPDTDYLLKQSSGKDIPSSWVTVDLSKPYTITGEELYVGVGSHGQIETVFSDLDSSAPDGLWFRFMGENGLYNNVGPGEWVKVSEQNKNFNHPIALQFVITGDNLPNDLAITDAVLKVDGKEHYTFEAKVKNYSLETVTAYTINWDFDGRNKGSQTITTSLAPSYSEKISIPISTIQFGERKHDFNYRVTGINGLTDGVSANSTGTYNFNAEPNTLYPRRIVLENGTGTWCGWCVNSIETISRLSREYPDNFIAINLHTDDVMRDPKNYREINNQFTSFPVAFVNRQNLIYPNYHSTKAYVESLKDRSEATVKASASYLKPDSSAVQIDTESIFGFTETKGCDYRLAYVVVEDHVGPYEQSNSFSGAVLDEETAYLEQWANSPSKVTIEHNQVARGIYGGVRGLNGSIPSVIKEGLVYKYQYSFVMPETIQNKRNTRIVVLLIDNLTGEIINACQTAINLSPEASKQKFDLRIGDTGILEGDTINCYTIYQLNGTTDCGTHFTDSRRELRLQTFDGKKAEGTARLDILDVSFTCERLVWYIGDIYESLKGKSFVEGAFATDSKGNVDINILASELKDYGSLTAKLSITIGGQTQTAYIKLHHPKPVVNNVTIKDGEVWWKNYDEVESSEIHHVGNNVAARNHAAIHVTKDMTGGTTVDGFAFVLYYEWAENVTVWLSTSLPKSDNDADVELIRIPQEQLITNLREFYQVAFIQSHEIPESGLYIGYSFDKTFPSYYPYSCVPGEPKGNLWVKTEKTNSGWTDLGTTYGNLKCEVLIGNKKEPGHDGIINVQKDAESSPFDVYDIQGRKVKSSTKSLAGLKEGIYIVNGKKIFIK